MEPDARPLVGREPELRRLETALARVDRREAACVALVGEPGIGKTRLLDELCDRANVRRCLVLDARASEYERDLPFGIFADALDDYLASLPPGRLEAIRGEDAAALGPIFPALAAGDAQTPTGAHQTERHRAYRAVRGLLGRLAARSPVVLALDDVHWSDDASVELISYLDTGSC
jgi:predicted ATPase